MDEVKIRKATLDDIETLLVFEQGVIRAERPFDKTLHEDPVNYYDIEAMIRADNIELVVAEIGEQIIGSGYARIEKSKHYLKHRVHAYLGFMYVVPEHRGKGINKKIINALKLWAQAQNITEFRLDVYHNNSAAIKAYENAGFVKHMIEMRRDV